MPFASHSATATVSNNRNSSKDGTYLRSLLLFLIVFTQNSIWLPGRLEFIFQTFYDTLGTL